MKTLHQVTPDESDELRYCKARWDSWNWEQLPDGRIHYYTRSGDAEYYESADALVSDIELREWIAAGRPSRWDQ